MWLRSECQPGARFGLANDKQAPHGVVLARDGTACVRGGCGVRGVSLRSRSALLWAVVGVAAFGGPSGCTRSEPAGVASDEALIVFAAASLRDAFAAMGNDFERLHPGVQLTFNFAGTQELRAQLQHGAVADVFASADGQHMSELVSAS